MIWLYLLLVLIGIVLVSRLAVDRSRYALVAATGALLAGVPIFAGRGIGLYLAPVALLLLGVAAWQLFGGRGRAGRGSGRRRKRHR